ncbi:MAG: acetylornithine deacetylase [Rhodobacterales bacterium]|nr:acetylornithine deacetylase [Rhodobacterales bacterium]
MTDPASLVSLDMIKKLVAIDTTSRNSNLDLIHFVQAYLADFGIDCLLVEDPDQPKANLYATIGPDDRPGVMLSGHTDVVPADPADWTRCQPFAPTVTEGRLYGRGTSDMKSFIGIALAHVPLMLERGMETPVHLALSYDEEVGCLGVRSLVEQLALAPIRPAFCVVGEPTSMGVMIAHKGKRSYTATVTGHEAHSSLAPHGVNAVEYAAELITFIRRRGRRAAQEGPFDADYDVPHTTFHVGTVKGGTALNIVPRSCAFQFEFRHLPQDDPADLFAEVEAHARDVLEPEMHAVQPDTGITFDEVPDLPALNTAPDDDVVAFVKALAGQNSHGKVAFATEAGLFQRRAGIPTVVCGPGSIEQAHKPDEFISLDQIAKGEAFMRRLIDRVAQPL